MKTALSFLSATVALFLVAGTPTCFAFQTGSRSQNHAVQRSSPSLESPLWRSQSTTPANKRSHNNNRNTRLAVWNEAVAAIDTFYQTAPYAAGALTCGAKASAADFVAQKRQLRAALQQQDDDDEGMRSKFELARNVAFLLYGAVYQGLAQEFIYNHCYEVWFGVGSQPLVVIQKVLFDLLIQTTLVTLPMAYLTKAAIFRYSFREGLRRYKNDVLKNGLLKKYFLLWGPVQCLTFSVVPEHLRITFIAAVSFFWLIILSTISGRKQEGEVALPTPSTLMSDMESQDMDLAETQEVRELANATATTA